MAGMDSPFSARISECREAGFPVTDEAEATANNLTVAPLDGGGLQLEMHAGGVDLEVTVAADGRIEDFYIAVVRLNREQR